MLCDIKNSTSAAKGALFTQKGRWFSYFSFKNWHNGLMNCGNGFCRTRRKKNTIIEVPWICDLKRMRFGWVVAVFESIHNHVVQPQVLIYNGTTNPSCLLVHVCVCMKNNNFCDAATKVIVHIEIIPTYCSLFICSLVDNWKAIAFLQDILMEVDWGIWE